jgi:hypothetical protein
MSFGSVGIAVTTAEVYIDCSKTSFEVLMYWQSAQHHFERGFFMAQPNQSPIQSKK